jgi:hypothetical protein
MPRANAGFWFGDELPIRLNRFRAVAVENGEIVERHVMRLGHR